MDHKPYNDDLSQISDDCGKHGSVVKDSGISNAEDSVVVIGFKTTAEPVRTACSSVIFELKNTQDDSEGCSTPRMNIFPNKNIENLIKIAKHNPEAVSEFISQNKHLIPSSNTSSPVKKQ
jgi:hypothetical protein